MEKNSVQILVTTSLDRYISSKCTLNCVRDSAIEMVNHKFLLIQSINLWWWEVGDPVSQNRSISPLQQNSQATPEVVDRLALFLSRVPGKRRAKFLDLPLPHTVPPTKSFCCQREESHTLPPAQLLCTIQLLVILD